MALAQANPVDKEVMQLLQSCTNNTRALCECFMKEAFFRPFGLIHQQIFDLLDNPSKQLKLIVAPRGIGKTSIVLKGLLSRHILFQLAKHVVYVSKSFTHAASQTENLKFELRTNPYFVDLFGDVKSDAFAKDEWTTSTGIHVVPRGSGQQVRGLLFRNYRPDLIVVDDLEDDKLVLNEDYTNELWEWFNSSLLNSVDRGGNSWQIVVIGTLLHENSVLARLLRDDKWATVRVSLADQDLRSNWPEFISNEKIAELYQDFSNRGLADLFAREYCGEVVARQDAAFRQSFFRYYKEGDKDVDFTETVILVDPAKTARHTADYTAVVGVGLNRLKGHIYVRDVVMDRLEPEQMYEHVLAMALRLRARVIGLEVTSLNEFILQPFKNYMLKHGHVFELVELKARDKKTRRISMLAPYYRQGNVYHNSSGVCRQLEAQLLSFPHSQYDDVMDALAYIIELMEIGGRYFSSAEAPDKNERAAYERLRLEDVSAGPINGWQFV